MSVITGQILPSSGLSSSIGPMSRITVQLLDVSLMDAPSTTLAEQVVFVGPEPVSFPIPFSLTYDANRVTPSMWYSIAARVTEQTEVVEEDKDQDKLTWISTTRYSVLTHDSPSDNIDVEIDPISYS
jgi:putative lipoprotein